ncbi:MAG: hypothetical protein J5767_13965, partial [Paludibacteraceae bacterium]|nr:hypothetical protein [Paludibacteraceae bacterium]
HRYLRLTELIPEILELVDSKVLALATAVEISFLNETVQKLLYEYMKDNGACKTYQIFAIRDHLKEHETITRLEVIKILNENRPKDESNRFQRIILTKPKLREFFPPFYNRAQMENVIFNLLSEWKKENEKEDT